MYLIRRQFSDPHSYHDVHHTTASMQQFDVSGFAELNSLRYQEQNSGILVFKYLPSSSNFKVAPNYAPRSKQSTESSAKP
jgi:hypothetical protein